MRLAVFLSLLAIVIGTTLSLAAPGDRLQLSDCHIPETKEALRCGTFQVPENRDIANGRILSLKVVVIPTRASKPREPIFFLSGGPGQAATDGAGGIAQSRSTFPDHDIVLMD